MDQIASIEKLKKSLDAINISDDYTELQNLITELHFAHESFRFRKTVPALSNQRTLWDAAYYLLTALTNPRRRSRVAAADVQDGLAISGLVFELLGRYAESREDINLQKDCFLNAAICNTLSRYEANSVVLAKVHFKDNLLPDGKEDYLSRPAEHGMNMVLALLAREFFWVCRNGPRLLGFLDSPEKVVSALACFSHLTNDKLAVIKPTVGCLLSPRLATAFPRAGSAQAKPADSVRYAVF